MVWRGLTKTTSYSEFTYQSRPEVPPCFVCHGFGFASPPFLLFFLSLLLLLPLISRIWQLQLLSWGHIVVWGQVAEERPDLCPGTMWRSGPRINDIIDWGHIFDQNWEWNLIMIRDYTGFDWKMKKIEIWDNTYMVIQSWYPPHSRPPAHLCTNWLKLLLGANYAFDRFLAKLWLTMELCKSGEILNVYRKTWFLVFPAEQELWAKS